MGVPVVTCIGESFAGRVAASLLKAIGMGELVTVSLDDYERLALRIAREPAFLKQLQERLRRNRASHPLFDTDRYRRNLESAYLRMWQTWQEGGSPESFAVQDECANLSQES
jgi:predicted O-linked N-acetylglucosamine transferase (SPINDLY family)